MALDRLRCTPILDSCRTADSTATAADGSTTEHRLGKGRGVPNIPDFVFFCIRLCFRCGRLAE